MRVNKVSKCKLKKKKATYEVLEFKYSQESFGARYKV